jgi:hypothetical protein
MLQRDDISILMVLNNDKKQENHLAGGRGAEQLLPEREDAMQKKPLPGFPDRGFMVFSA